MVTTPTPFTDEQLAWLEEHFDELRAHAEAEAQLAVADHEATSHED